MTEGKWVQLELFPEIDWESQRVPYMHGWKCIYCGQEFGVYGNILDQEALFVEMSKHSIEHAKEDNK